MVGWLFGSFVVLLLIGTPIAASLGLAAVITIVMSGMRVNMVVVGQTMFAGMTSYQLMAIPLFILCGNLMCDGGLSKKLVDFINLFCRKSKGALAYVTILASAFFAAISGSSPATTAAIGGIMAPEMQKNGYDEDFSLATAAAAADAQRRVAMATADQVDTRAEMIAQLDEQIAALDLKIRQLQGGNSAAMLSGPLLKAAGLGIERRKLADERARLAGEDPAPRKPEPPQAEQKRPRGHKPKH